jgi:hypothetical protein
MSWLLIGLPLLLTVTVVSAQDSAKPADKPPAPAKPEPPLRWIQPKGFSTGARNLGIKSFSTAVTHKVIYDPKPSKGNVNEGGSGKYESVNHGQYNHHANGCLFEDKLIVFWTNHSFDENGPGQRILAKVGTFNADRSEIDWGGIETLAEVAPPPVPVRRRSRQHDPEVINEHFFYGHPVVVNGRLYFRGGMTAVHGYTDDRTYAHLPLASGTVPAAHWRDSQDEKAGFHQEVYWGLGYTFVQKWKVQGKTIVPDSPIYKVADMLKSPYEITPGRFKKIIDPAEMYLKAPPLSEAPEQMRDDLKNGKPVSFRRGPRYASAEASYITTDGRRDLIHNAVFRRPDGKWVVIRDVTAGKGGIYYAALKDTEEDYFPPATRTTLPGYAMPAAGELSNGWVWIMGNLPPRRQFTYITVSTNGVVFDRTRHLLTIEGDTMPQRIGGGGGPQYPHAIMAGNTIWIVYSIAKVKLGVTRLPAEELTRLYDPGVTE